MQSDPNSIASDFRKVARLAGAELEKTDLQIEVLSAPHRPTGLPPGTMAVSHRGKALKVGKAGPNSDARYRSQHYNPKSARSTLAASILKDGSPVGEPQIDIDSVGNWIRQNTDRTNFILQAHSGIEVLTLLEAYVQCILKPAYEGFASQR